MYDQITWYLSASSVVVTPLFVLAAAHWWQLNNGAHDSAVSTTRMGIFVGVVACMPPTIFYAFTSRHPVGDYGTLLVACRWSGELFALIALACSVRGRGWMRIVLAAFSAWAFLQSFILLRVNP